MTQERTEAAAPSEQEGDPTAVLELARKDPRVREGDLEIDENAVVSWGSDNGAYVQAWLWVDFNGTQLDQTTKGDDAGDSGD